MTYAYVGYMYTSGQVHGIQTSSTIKTYLDEWYQNNLINYTEKIDGNAGFCGDRTPYSMNESSGNYTYTSGGGTWTTETYYGFWRRNWYANSSVYVTLKCENSNDLYTTKGSSKGNKALTYPVGLITADEAVFTGGLYPSETSRTYLHSDVIYWTITPWRYLYNAVGSTVSMYGPFATEYDISTSMSVRPVINLKFDTLFKAGGAGTDDNPFEAY